MLFGHFVSRALQIYWRLRRGLQLGVEACVVDRDGKVLLVEGSGPGRWTLPGGKVRKGETFEMALRRRLREDHGLEVRSKPQLYWVYAADGSHIQQMGFFVVRDWDAPSPFPAPGTFFAVDALAEKIGPRSAGRVKHALDGRAPAEVC